MILFLDTTDFHVVRFVLVFDGHKVLSKKYPINLQTEKVLNLLDQFLSEKIKSDFSKIESIYVAVGSGSFTGIRVGISIALAFNTAINVPIFAVENKNLPKNLANIVKMKKKKITSGFEVKYAAKPNITKEKEKFK